jgi:hypothetical protein
MGRRWTDEDIEELKRLLQQYPLPTIAELTDRTVGGVTFKAHQLKLSPKSRREVSSDLGSFDPGRGGFESEAL